VKHISVGILAVLGVAAVLASTGCSSGGDGSPATAGPTVGLSEVRIAGGDVLIGGQSVDGRTIAPGSGTATLFTVTLADPADAPRVRAMYMDYPIHHDAMGMMGDHATVQCWDDGTHCDTVAGDGRYCYYDETGHVGPHDGDCPDGDYVYTFHGIDTSDAPTNSVECRVTVR
jgi:hypothetical protein